MEKKKFTVLGAMRFGCRFTIVWAILYVLLSVFAGSADLELRTWISIPSMLIIALCLPLLAGAYAIGRMLEKMQQESEKRVGEGIGVTLLLFALVIYLCAAAAVFILSGSSWMQKETKVTKTVLQSVGKAFPWEESASGGYYRPVGFFFKKKYAYDDLRVVNAVLEQRYGKEFVLTAAERSDETEAAYGTVLVCSAAPKEEPSLIFRVTAERGAVTYYTDNYPEVKQKQHWQDVMSEQEFPAEKYDAEETDDPAAEASIREKADPAAESDTGEMEDRAAEDETEKSDALPPEKEAERGFGTPESAYEKLYETVFAPEGYSSETTYNAKGNFYAVLSREEDEDADRTVVYDRVSKNGKCQIFVCYSGSGQNERIFDFYAVDMESGTVTAGNKQAWTQTASAQYQEATGEK